MVDKTPTHPHYTNKHLGEGIFDQLMGTVGAHLQREMAEDRIDKAQWAQVYTGMMEVAMSNSTQFILGMLLIDEKRDQIELQNALIELQKEELRFKIDYLYPLEVRQLEHEIDKLAAEIIYIAKQGELIDSQIRVHDSQIELNDSTILTHAKQREKLDKEIEFMTAKIKTERANTESGVASFDSLIGRQKALLVAQKLGFAGDLKNKLAKVYADYDSVYLTVHEVQEAAPSGAAQGLLSDGSAIANDIKNIS